jgi:hypothetical protein
MTSYNPHNDAFIACTHWNDEFVLYPYPNHTVDAPNTIYYAHPQTNPGTISLPTIPAHFSPPYVPLPPLYPSPISQQPNPPQPTLHIVDDAGSYNLPLPWNAPIHHPYVEPSAALSLSPTTITPTTTSNPILAIVPTVINPERAKFPCPSCGKLCTSRPRAYTCFCNHIGAKPFACNGDCGRVGWLVLCLFSVQTL